jgi:hypothetical protein
MTKTELESKHLSDLHKLAADAGVERYRMLSRTELIDALADGDGDIGGAGDGGSGSGTRGGRSRGGRGRSGSRGGSGSGSGDEERGSGSRGGRTPAAEEEDSDDDERGDRPRRRRRRSSTAGREREARIDVEDEEEIEPSAPRAKAREEDDEDEGSRSRRRRRPRRRFGRRREGVTIQDLLLPAESGRQAVLLADGREAATELLRSVAADLAGASEGPDPVALLIDPSPEELADWKREAPQAELVSAGQARHANDALASAQRRAAEGEDVILLVDSLTRFTESFGDTDGAKALFDAGRVDTAEGKGSLTVVVALER